MKNSKSRDCSRNGNPLLAGSVKKCIKKVKSCLRSSLAGKSIEVSLNKVWRMGVLSKLLENYFWIHLLWSRCNLCRILLRELRILVGFRLAQSLLTFHQHRLCPHSHLILCLNRTFKCSLTLRTKWITKDIPNNLSNLIGTSNLNNLIGTNFNRSLHNNLTGTS